MENTDNEFILEQVKVFADNCHGDQMRRYVPDRYIVHPLRVMKLLKQYTDDVTVLSAALLHDVLEDTAVGKAEIKNFLATIMSDAQAEAVVRMVEELTDVYIKEKYPKWNRRKRKNKEAERLENTSSEAQTIKYADIIDNAPEIAEKDPDFARRFLYEYRALLKKLRKGNPDLYEKAIETVNACIAINGT
jgi:guanosine-3',5'-bis(diphosphate) 3'-pyrophosphohydrolase